jgi:SAM-dependent methyltransferase
MAIRDLILPLGKNFAFIYDLRSIYWLWSRRGGSSKHCVCCNADQPFRLYGFPPRVDALCPTCMSLERHRLIKLYYDRNREAFDNKTVLHFAPEKSTRKWLEPGAKKYVCGDYYPVGDQIKLDIESLQFGDGEFDLILCSHVLEHVDDTKALRELFRVTKPGGRVLLLFPLVEGWSRTFEDAKIVSESDRLKYYGQKDHVRIFGADARARIKAAGFQLSEFTAEEPDCSAFGLFKGEKIFVAARPAK